MRAVHLVTLLLAAATLAPAGQAAAEASRYEQRACPEHRALSFSASYCEVSFFTSLDAGDCDASCPLVVSASGSTRGLPTPKSIALSLDGQPLCAASANAGVAGCSGARTLEVESGCRTVALEALGTIAGPSTSGALSESVRIVHEYRACRGPEGLAVALVAAR